MFGMEKFDTLARSVVREASSISRNNVAESETLQFIDPAGLPDTPDISSQSSSSPTTTKDNAPIELSELIIIVDDELGDKDDNADIDEQFDFFGVPSIPQTPEIGEGLSDLNSGSGDDIIDDVDLDFERDAANTEDVPLDAGSGDDIIDDIVLDNTDDGNIEEAIDLMDVLDDDTDGDLALFSLNEGVNNATILAPVAPELPTSLSPTGFGEVNPGDFVPPDIVL